MKIASWNVSGFRKSKTLNQYDYEKESDLIYFADIIKKVNPDILLLQENLSNDFGSFTEKINKYLNFEFVFDSRGSKSFIDTNYFETMSALSKIKIDEVFEINNINPNWKVKMSNGYEAKSFDRKF